MIKSKEELLEEHFISIKDCIKCDLHKNRTQIVYGSGNINAEILLCGEAPGMQEDESGSPFVGKAGKELTQNYLEFESEKELSQRGIRI